MYLRLHIKMNGTNTTFGRERVVLSYWPKYTPVISCTKNDSHNTNSRYEIPKPNSIADIMQQRSDYSYSN